LHEHAVVPRPGASRGRPRSSHSRERARGRAAERHHALLVALARHGERSPAQVHLRALEADQLRDAQAAGVRQLQHRAVAQRERPTRPAGCAISRSMSRERERVRQLALAARCRQDRDGSSARCRRRG
jgi:hypothetical protein